MVSTPTGLKYLGTLFTVVAIWEMGRSEARRARASAVARLADEFGIETIWDEATASSARFYEKVLKIPQVKDLFIIRRDMMRDIAQRYFTRQERRLAKTNRKDRIS